MVESFLPSFAPLTATSCRWRWHMVKLKLISGRELAMVLVSGTTGTKWLGVHVFGGSWFECAGPYGFDRVVDQLIFSSDGHFKLFEGYVIGIVNRRVNYIHWHIDHIGQNARRFHTEEYCFYAVSILETRGLCSLTVQCRSCSVVPLPMTRHQPIKWKRNWTGIHYTPLILPPYTCKQNDIRLHISTTITYVLIVHGLHF